MMEYIGTMILLPDCYYHIDISKHKYYLSNIMVKGKGTQHFGKKHQRTHT